MKLSKIEPPMIPYASLCYFDPRNPNGNPLPDDDDDPRQPRELGCACDNCFYGRDKLAMEIIRLRDAISEHAEVVRDTVHAGEDIDRRLWSVLEPKR